MTTAPIPAQTQPYSASAPPPAYSSGTQPTGGTGVLTGEVLHLMTGQPLGGATISVAGRSVISDERGEFRLEGVPVGYLTVQASKQGFRAASQRVDLQTAGINYVEFSLRPEGGY